jgi:hypothetical protein
MSVPIDYSKLTDGEIKNKARAITQSSLDDAEVKRRLKNELGYPYGSVAISRGSRGMIALMMWSSKGKILFF